MFQRFGPSAGAVTSAGSMPQGLQGVAILTKREAAALLQTTARYIERQIRAGRLRACKPSSRVVRILRRDLDAFLESGATIAGSR
jgi:excisionase family DNA binding protein